MPLSTEYIAAALKAARKRKELTQRNLSKRTRVPQSHISKIEKGAVDLHMSSLVEIARSLELEVMLVPRQLVLVVEALQRAKGNEEQIPLYRFQEDAQDG